MVKHIHRSTWADLGNLKSIMWGLQEPMRPHPQSPCCCPLPPGQLSPCLGEGWHRGSRHCWTGTGGRVRLQVECKEQVGVHLGWAGASLQMSLSQGDGSLGGSHAGRWWSVGDAWGLGSSVALVGGQEHSSQRRGWYQQRNLRVGVVHVFNHV